MTPFSTLAPTLDYSNPKLSYLSRGSPLCPRQVDLGMPPFIHLDWPLVQVGLAIAVQDPLVGVLGRLTLKAEPIDRALEPVMKAPRHG
jgi:hypothetical protein